MDSPQLPLMRASVPGRSPIHPKRFLVSAIEKADVQKQRISLG